MLEIDESWLVAGAHQNQDGIDQYAYASGDQATNIIIGNMACAPAACETVFDNFLKSVNQQATANSGIFSVVSPTEYRAEWKLGGARNFLSVSRLSGSLLIWNYTAPLGAQSLPVTQYFDRLRAFVDRQRYEQAMAGGNVEMGRWDGSLREYAQELLKDGKRQEAVAVLTNVVTTSPTDYEAQIMLATSTSDPSIAKNSARVVFENTENPELISKSARLLQEIDPASVQLPVLDKEENGLRVVLIPLAPCDIGILARVANVYSGITKIPVKIVRMKDVWQFGPPDRLPNRRQIQQFIAQRGGSNPDFTGWTLERYKTELLRASASSDALTKFSVNALVAPLGTSSGQYSVDPYLEKFADIVARYRSNDPRTLYVGITGADISSGDANFVFSTTVSRPEGHAAILSYHMMLSKTLNDQRESRSRLAERIAKELVPATLNQLDIPRPVDPADPFSYSSGVDRLDQKTLVLSKPTEDALAKFR